MRDSGLTVAVFALGSAFKFFEKDLKRNDGTLEYYNMIKLLARNPSIDKLLLMSRNNWHKVDESLKREIDPRHVIINPYDEHDGLTEQKPPGSERNLDVQLGYLEYHTRIIRGSYKVDFGVGFMSQGYATVSTQPGFLNTVTDPTRPARCLSMCYYYASPIINWLNRSNIDWFMVSTDPRYIKQKVHYRDTSNLPRSIWGQYDLTVNWKHIEAFEKTAEIVTDKVESRYAQVEKINIIGKEVVDPAQDRPNKLVILAMQLSPMTATRDDRFNEIKDWLIGDPDIHIYGKWSELLTEGNEQFKGFINSDEIDDMFSKTRYTLVLPTKFKWVTSKYSEMLQVGVVPFFHPDYDDQYHILGKDHYLRVKTPEDLRDKIKWLDDHPEERIKLVRELQDIHLKDIDTGKFLLDEMNKELNDIGFELKDEIDETESKRYFKNALF